MNPPSGSGHGALVARALAGDRLAVEALLVESLPWLEAYLRLQVGGALRKKESLSDLVQSVCVEALRDLSKFEFRGEGQFRHWLCKHALHKVVNKREYYDAQKRDMAREVGLGQGGSGDSVASVLQCYASLCTPSRHAAGREELARFEAAFDTLPEDMREAITLRRIVELEYDAIAAAMQRSEGAVRNLVYRGLARLSGLLQNSGADRPSSPPA
ncbi:MAG: RNA polymerase sigma factor [Planctomycetota bacterium]